MAHDCSRGGSAEATTPTSPAPRQKKGSESSIRLPCAPCRTPITSPICRYERLRCSDPSLPGAPLVRSSYRDANLSRNASRCRLHVVIGSQDTLPIWQSKTNWGMASHDKHSCLPWRSKWIFFCRGYKCSNTRMSSRHPSGPSTCLIRRCARSTFLRCPC